MAVAATITVGRWHSIASGHPARETKATVETPAGAACGAPTDSS